MAVSTEIVREAPFLEDIRKKLLGSADILTQTPITLPKQQLAPFSTTTQQAFELARTGLGGYKPYLGQAAGQLGQAGQFLGGAAGQIPLAGGALGQQQQQLAAAGQTFDPQSQFLGAAGQTFDPQSQQLGVAGQTLGEMGGERAAGRAQLTGAEGILGGLAGRGPGALNEARQAAFLGAGDITGRIGAFQDPNQQLVIDAFQAEAARSAELARNRANQQAVQSGAFGGSRSGVQGAELERNIADVTQRNIAGLLSQGYGQSLGAAEREAGRFQQLPGQLMGIEQLQYSLPGNVATQMQQAAAQRGALGQQAGAEAAQRQALAQGYGAQGQQMGQLAAGYGAQGQQRGALAQGYGQLAAGRQSLAGAGAALAGATQNLGGAYSGLAGLAQQLPAQDVALLSQVGSQQQQQGQRQLDLARQNIMQQTYEPYQRIGYMSDILKGQPSTQSTLTQSTDPRGNQLSQALGAGISLAGIFGSGGYGTGYLFGQAGNALAGRT